MGEIPPEKTPKPGLNIYGCAAVNPVKLSIAAEELGIPYNYIYLDMGAGEPKAEWYESINPNGRMPALVHVKDDGTSVTVFESAACLQYITSEFDKENKLSYPIGSSGYWTQLSWLSWQVAGYGPMMGESNHYNRYATKPVSYGVWRATAECRRLHHVLDKQLSKTPFIAGDQVTIADIAIFVFAYAAKWCGIDMKQYPHVKAWREKLAGREGFQKGLQVPVPFKFFDEAVMDPEPEGQKFYGMIRKGAAQWIKQSSDQWYGEPVALPSDFSNYAT